MRDESTHQKKSEVRSDEHLLSSMSSANEPPPPNPILTAYEDFVASTPLVTRTLLSIQVISYAVSWIYIPFFALANIPHFTIGNFEIYRLLLAPFIEKSLFSVIFSFILFLDHGKRLEHSMGSASFGWFCFVIGIATNIFFCVICYILYGVTADKGVLFRSSSGLYTIIFGTMALDATQAPRTSERRLCFVNVPTFYFPLVLGVLFTLLGGHSFSCLISMGIGYLIGLVEPAADAIKLSKGKAKEWEDTILQNFCRRPGWVYGHASTGQDAWNDATGGLSMPSFLTRNANNSSGSSSSGPSSTSVPSGSATTTSETAFEALADGHVLGGAGGGGGATPGTATTRRGAAEARAARLEALERGEASRKSAALGSGLL